MHESYMAEGLLAEVSHRARDKNIRKVSRIGVKLGGESHITMDSLRTHFQQLSRRTLAEGASLEIERVAGDSLFLAFFEGE